MESDSLEDKSMENDIFLRKNSRELVLSKLEDAIEFLHDKSLKGKVRDPQKEKVRIQWFKALSYACSIYNQISRDSDIDDLKEQIEALSEQLERLGNV